MTWSQAKPVAHLAGFRGHGVEQHWSTVWGPAPGLAVREVRSDNRPGGEPPLDCIEGVVRAVAPSPREQQQPAAMTGHRVVVGRYAWMSTGVPSGST